VELKSFFPDCVLVAGNVVTPELVYELISRCGVDIVKIGIGSGAVCTTRLKAGVGYPQLSAILECKSAAKAGGGYIISDGGIVNPCDIAKAFVAGADFVMCGSMLAGHTESPGDIIVDTATGDKYKTYYGMASDTAVQKYNDGKMGYRTAEGKKVRMKLKGHLYHTLDDINGSLRSTCSYTDARNLEQLYEKARFIEVNATHNTSLE
jgi:GMP reductase